MHLFRSQHPTEGELRAYMDGELSHIEQEVLKQHIASCVCCQEKVEYLSNQSRQVYQRISALNPAHPPIPANAARLRLESYRHRKESSTMFNHLFSRRFRMAWLALGLILVLGASLFFPPVQAIANDFLGLFRVQQISVIQVNPGNLPQQLGSSAQLEQMLTKDVQVNDQGPAQPVTNAAEASQKAGFQVRLPQNQTPARLEYQPGATVSYKVDLQQVRGILADIGRSDIQIPDSVNGATVEGNIPGGVIAQYGSCNFNPEVARKQGYDPDNQRLPSLPDCTTLLQLPSPTINTPPGLDLQKLGEAFLEVMGVSPQDAARLSQNIDWATTLVVPIPTYGFSYQSVSVDGASGTFIQQDQGSFLNQSTSVKRSDGTVIQRSSSKPQYLLMWVKGGLLYVLTGPGSQTDAVAFANSLK
jgi:hypothetical protein